MVKKKYVISAETGTKLKIIELILNNKGPVEEAEMRKKLPGDSGNINRHLHELWEELDCIELTQTIKKGRRKYNLWDITKIKHLKNINGKFLKIQLNRHEKSINIIARNLGYDINSPMYLYCFIRLYMSRSFFNECLNTDVKSLTTKILKIYRVGAGLEDETHIKELINEYNSTYIKDKFNFEISDQKFRDVMEDLAQPQQMKEMLEDYVWRTYGMPKDQLKNIHGDSFIETNIKRVEEIVEFLYDDPKLSVKPEEWIESFFDKFKEKVPESSKINIKTILKKPDEYENICQKTSELLFFIKKQQENFRNTFFNLLFESFRTQDIINESDLPEELDFAEKTNKCIIEYNDTLKKEYNKTFKKRDYGIIKGAVDLLIFNEHKIISEFMAKHKMPSILSKISDDPKKVLRELLKLHGYQHLFKYLESGSVE